MGGGRSVQAQDGHRAEPGATGRCRPGVSALKGGALQHLHRVVPPRHRGHRDRPLRAGVVQFFGDQPIRDGRGLRNVRRRGLRCPDLESELRRHAPHRRDRTLGRRQRRHARSQLFRQAGPEDGQAQHAPCSLRLRLCPQPDGHRAEGRPVQCRNELRPLRRGFLPQRAEARRHAPSSGSAPAGQVRSGRRRGSARRSGARALLRRCHAADTAGRAQRAGPAPVSAVCHRGDGQPTRVLRAGLRTRHRPLEPGPDLVLEGTAEPRRARCGPRDPHASGASAAPVARLPAACSPGSRCLAPTAGARAGSVLGGLRHGGPRGLRHVHPHGGPVTDTLRGRIQPRGHVVLPAAHEQRGHDVGGPQRACRVPAVLPGLSLSGSGRASRRRCGAPASPLRTGAHRCARRRPVPVVLRAALHGVRRAPRGLPLPLHGSPPLPARDARSCW